MPWSICLNDNFRDEAQFYLFLGRLLRKVDQCLREKEERNKSNRTECSKSQMNTTRTFSHYDVEYFTNEGLDI